MQKCRLYNVSPNAYNNFRFQAPHPHVWKTFNEDDISRKLVIFFGCVASVVVLLSADGN